MTIAYIPIFRKLKRQSLVSPELSLPLGFGKTMDMSSYQLWASLEVLVILISEGKTEILFPLIEYSAQ